MTTIQDVLLRMRVGEIVPEEWNPHSIKRHVPVPYPRFAAKKVSVTLDFANCIYYQAGLKELALGNEGIVGTYEEWGGSESHNGDVCDAEYNRFCWLVKEGQEVKFMTPLARIRTKNRDTENYYWILLVAPCDGVVHKLCRNGIRSVGHGEPVAVIYETEEEYILDSSEDDELLDDFGARVTVYQAQIVYEGGGNHA